MCIPVLYFHCYGACFVKFQYLWRGGIFNILYFCASWQWRFSLLEHCVAYVFSFPLLRIKHMATTISVMGIPWMKWGHGAKPKYLCCTVISKVTIGMFILDYGYYGSLAPITPYIFNAVLTPRVWSIAFLTRPWYWLE